MTCDELAEQVATLTANLDAIDTSVASENSQATQKYLALLPSDTYGGTYPSGDPLTVAEIDARVTYLGMQMPRPPQALFDGYQAIVAILLYVQNTLLPTRQQTVAQLGSFKQQQVDQNCIT